MSQTVFFFDEWSGALRVFVVGALAYAGLVVTVRVSGKRTLSQLNTFDFIITIALGSTLATVVLSKSVALIEGLLAFTLLIGLQWLIAATSVRSPTLQRLVRARPEFLAREGEMDDDALRRNRILRDDVLAAVRQSGSASLFDVEAVVLETDGQLSVVKKTEGRLDALEPVEGRAPAAPPAIPQPA